MRQWTFSDPGASNKSGEIVRSHHVPLKCQKKAKKAGINACLAGECEDCALFTNKAGSEPGMPAAGTSDRALIHQAGTGQHKTDERKVIPRRETRGRGGGDGGG